MAIQINRFEPVKLKQNSNFTAEKDKAVVIKDHKDDRIIGLVNLNRTLDRNMDLAELVIQTIEDWVEEHEDKH